MPQTTGLGAFTEGLQGGMAARSKRDASKQYERILADRADVADRDWQNVLDTEQSQWMTEHGGSTEGYVAPTRTTIRDPALIRMGKFLGSKIKGFFGGGGEEEGALGQMGIASPEIAPSSPVQQQAVSGFQQGQGIPGQQGPMQPSYRDGGLVRGYQDGGRVEDEHGAGGFAAYLTEDIPRAAGDLVKSGFRSTISEGKEYMADEAMRRESLTEEGISAGQRGERTRDYIGEGVLAIPRMASAVTKDVLAPLKPAASFVGGFLGFDGGEEGISTPTPEAATEDPAAGEAVKAAIDAPDKSDGQIAEEAMSEGEQYALENLDYKLLIDQGVRPEELPSMSTKDWADYRSHMFQLEIGRGRSPKEAMQSVEYTTVDMQMRGMMRELDKATQYLGTGQNREAAMAIRQGFQYFPNGVSVKFGTVKDPKTGLPAIIAMGANEETGEVTGSPMIITADRLSALRAQMSDPKAFSAWTKDGHDLQISVAKLKETQKPNVAMEDIYATNAETARARAAASAKGGGFSAAELRQREAVYRTEIGNDLDLVLDEPEHARSLARAMSKLESMYPGIAQNAVLDEVYRAYDADRENMSGVEALINPQAQQTGIPEG